MAGQGEKKGLVPQLSLLYEVLEGGLLPRHVAASDPPGESKSKSTRYLDMLEDDQFDEAQFERVAETDEPCIVSRQFILKLA